MLLTHALFGMVRSHQNSYLTLSKISILVHLIICIEIFGLNIAEVLAMRKTVLATDTELKKA